MTGTVVMYWGHVSACSLGLELHGPLECPGHAVPLVGVGPELSCFKDCGSGPILDNPGT